MSRAPCPGCKELCGQCSPFGNQPSEPDLLAEAIVAEERAGRLRELARQLAVRRETRAARAAFRCAIRQEVVAAEIRMAAQLVSARPPAVVLELHVGLNGRRAS